MKVAAIIPNYNSGHLTTQVVLALLGQRLPSDIEFQVIVVDDGSSDDSVQALERRFRGTVQLVCLDQNRGRSNARNVGAKASDAELLIFLDGDCVPSETSFVSAHAAAIAAGNDVSFGDVLTPGPGFWNWLQRDASERRARQFSSGQKWVLTTQNVAIRRRAFDLCGGFDPAYDRYGFEDRDLFARLGSAQQRMCHTRSAGVRHCDQLSLLEVSRKFEESGRHSAALFSHKHPGIYRQMPLSRFDCHLHPWLRHLDKLTNPISAFLTQLPSGWLEWSWIPIGLRALIARSVYTMRFLHGTNRSSIDRASR